MKFTEKDFDTLRNCDQRYAPETAAEIANEKIEDHIVVKREKFFEAFKNLNATDSPEWLWEALCK